MHLKCHLMKLVPQVEQVIVFQTLNSMSSNYPNNKNNYQINGKVLRNQVQKMSVPLIS